MPPRVLTPSRARVLGFSLVELMVALAAGLVVSGALMAFVVSMLRSHNENVLATRLMQNMRTSHAFISREIRRAGFNRDALRIIANPAGYNGAYADLQFSGEAAIDDADCPAVVASGLEQASTCMVFAYDRVGVNDGAQAPNGLEWKGVRRVVDDEGLGQLQAFLGTSGAAVPDCEDPVDDANWTDMTPPGQDISRFLLVNRESEDIEVGTVPGAVLTVRQVFVQIDGQVAGTTIRRRLCEDVRIRADRLSFPPPPAEPEVP